MILHHYTDCLEMTRNSLVKQMESIMKSYIIPYKPWKKKHLYIKKTMAGLFTNKKANSQYQLGMF